MHRLGNRTHVLIGLCVLAGLVVVGINGTMLMSLLDEPLAGYSDGVRNTDQRFRQYRQLKAAEAQKITAGIDLLASRYTPIVVAVEEKPAVQKAIVPRLATKPVARPAVELPILTGVITSRSTDGIDKRLAVMDGRVFAEGDQLRDLTVKWISSGGVLVARGDQDWFLNAPEIAYSVTTQ